MYLWLIPALWLLASPLVLNRLLQKLLFRFNADSVGSREDKEILFAGLAARGFTIESVAFSPRHGVTLNAVLIRHPRSNWVFNFHMGRNNSIESCLDFVRAYAACGSVFIAEPSGFGKSTGNANTESFLADALASRHELIRRGFANGQIIACGDSLGSGAACLEAIRYRAPALVLSAAFTSLVRMLRQEAKFLHLYPSFMFPSSAVMDNTDMLRRLTVPVLLIHGRDDPFITPDHAKTLSRSASGPATLVLVKAEHRNIAGFDPGPFEAAVSGFVESLPAPH